MRAAVVLRGDFDVLVVPSAIRFLVLNAKVREMDLLIEVREVVFACPTFDFLCRPVRVTVIVVAVPIALVQPGLVLALQLVVEDHALDVRAPLLKAFCFTLIGTIDLDVVLPFPLTFEPGVERLLVPVVAVSVTLQKTPSLLRQHDRMVAIARDASGFDQPLFAQMPQVAGAWIGRPIMVVSEVTTGDNPKRANGCERARFRPAQGVLTVAIANKFPLQSARQVRYRVNASRRSTVSLTVVAVAFRPACVIMSIPRMLI